MSGEQAVLTAPNQKLLDWLASHHVDFEVHQHATTYTARETARAEHVSPTTFAKAIGVVTDDGRRALMVLDAADHLDMLKARRALAAIDVRLMREDELASACGGCEVGAAPPIGELFSMPTHVDEALRDVRILVFHAGSHNYTVHVERQAWERALGVRYEALAERRNLEPAWMNS